MLCMMTDREPAEIQIGMPVTMSFRKLRTVNGITNYYWKAVPLRPRPPAPTPASPAGASSRAN